MGQLGEELGVAYVLDITVRSQRPANGPREVSVRPQLIQVAEDTLLWGHSYEAVLAADIFEVQSQIAAEVIDVLGIALAETERAALVAEPTSNSEAYDLYLRGRDYLTRAREVMSPEDGEFAVGSFRDAVALDPAFAVAHAQLAVAHSWLWDRYMDRSDSRVALARQAVDEALRLDPTLPEARYALGLVYAAEGKREAARAEHLTLLDRQPDNAEVHEALANVLGELGEHEASYASNLRAADLNPRVGSLQCWAGGRMFALREFDNALAHHTRAIELRPDRACPYACVLEIHVNADGDTAGARRFLEEIPARVDLEARPPINYRWAMLEILDGNYDAALARLSLGSSEVYEFQEYYVPKARLRAQVYGLMGDTQQALQQYEAARELLEARRRESPNDDRVHSSLGVVYAGLGRPDDAVREGELGLALLGGIKDERLGYRIQDLAQIYALIAEPDQAIDQLERLLSLPAFISAGWLSLDPTWDPLREYPDFQTLIGSV